MSNNNTINQRLNPKMHRSEMDERYKLAKVAKGGVIYYGLPIPDTMLNDLIRDMDAYKEVRKTGVGKCPMRRGEGGVPEPTEGLERIDREKRVFYDEISDDLDDTLKAIKTKKMKGVVEYENEEPEILTDAQLLLDFKKTCKDSLYCDRTLSATWLDVANEGDEDDASNFIILVREKSMVDKEKRTPILKIISSPRTQLSQDNISRYLNKNPVPSLEDVGLPRIAGTLGLNSQDGSSGKDKPIGDSEHSIIGADDPIPSPPITKIITTKPTASKQKKHIDEFINHKVLAAVQESVSTKVIQEVKNHAPTLVTNVVADIVRPRLHKFVSHILRTEQITLTSSPALSSTNITIPQLKEILYEMMTNNLDSIAENLKKQTHDDQDPPKNYDGEKGYKKSRFVGQLSSRNDQAMPDAGDHETQPSATRKTQDRFNEVVDTYPDLDVPKNGEIVHDNSTFTLSKRIKRCLKIDMVNLSKMEEFKKNGYELFGNHFMSKAEYDYNMNQMTIPMLDDMDWALDHGLGIDNKEPLPLIGPKLNQRIPLKHFFNDDLKILKTRNKDLKKRKYAFSVTNCHAAEYKCGWIKEDIGYISGKLWLIIT
ncbi:hypothetical protein Tco_0086112 [Tanacetum coccineum]